MTFKNGAEIKRRKGGCMNTFKQWRAEMGFRNQKQAAEALGYSLARVKQWEANPAKHQLTLSVRLAMAALYHKIEPWNE